MKTILYIGLATLLINIPFGYWRETVVKFSWQWFVAVHAAVPAVIAMRMYADIDWQVKVIAFFVLCYFAGQFVGSRWKRRSVSI
ncbi:MAG: hypothetical protein ACR2P9_06355 [Gammaproteobacteria bacterium]